MLTPLRCTIHLTQQGLIASILRDLNFHDKEVQPKYIPASQILHADHMGQERKDCWKYHSIISKLNFLVQNSCLDIAFAVHQCAHFCKNPKCLHEKQSKKVLDTYGLQMLTVLFLKSNGTYQLHAYSRDSNFAGL